MYYVKFNSINFCLFIPIYLYFILYLRKYYTIYFYPLYPLFSGKLPNAGIGSFNSNYLFIDFLSILSTILTNIESSLYFYRAPSSLFSSSTSQCWSISSRQRVYNVLLKSCFINDIVNVTILTNIESIVCLHRAPSWLRRRHRKVDRDRVTILSTSYLISCLHRRHCRNCNIEQHLVDNVSTLQLWAHSLEHIVDIVNITILIDIESTTCLQLTLLSCFIYDIWNIAIWTKIESTLCLHRLPSFLFTFLT